MVSMLSRALVAILTISVVSVIGLLVSRRGSPDLAHQQSLSVLSQNNVIDDQLEFLGLRTTKNDQEKPPKTLIEWLQETNPFPSLTASAIQQHIPASKHSQATEPTPRPPPDPSEVSNPTLLEWLQANNPFQPISSEAQTVDTVTSSTAALSDVLSEKQLQVNQNNTLDTTIATAVDSLEPFVTPFLGTRREEVQRLLTDRTDSTITLYFYHVRKAAGTTILWFLFNLAKEKRWRFAHTEGVSFNPTDPMRGVQLFCDFREFPSPEKQKELKWKNTTFVSPDLLHRVGVCCKGGFLFGHRMSDECKLPWYLKWRETHASSFTETRKDTIFITNLRNPSTRLISSYIYEGRWKIAELKGRFTKGVKLIPTNDNAKPFMEWYKSTQKYKFFDDVLRKSESEKNLTALDRMCEKESPRHWECAEECYTKWFSNYPCIGRKGGDGQRTTGHTPVDPFWLQKARDGLSAFDLIIRAESLNDKRYENFLQNMFRTKCEIIKVGAYGSDVPRPPFIPSNEEKDFIEGLNEFDKQLYNEFAVQPSRPS